MILSNIPNVWVVIGAGVALWLISQKLPSNGRVGSNSSAFARLLSLLGLVAMGVGIYAGFRGPVTIGPVTLEKFPFAGLIQQSNIEALSYSHSNLDISRQPAVGWGGNSRTTLLYTVKNNGNRGISRLILRFSTKDNSTVDLPLDGPFPQGRTSTAIVPVPSNVNSSYFSSSAVNSNVEVVGARF
jgi:hypothetical protein